MPGYRHGARHAARCAAFIALILAASATAQDPGRDSKVKAKPAIDGPARGGPNDKRMRRQRIFFMVNARLVLRESFGRGSMPFPGRASRSCWLAVVRRRLSPSPRRTGRGLGRGEALQS